MFPLVQKMAMSNIARRSSALAVSFLVLLQVDVAAFQADISLAPCGRTVVPGHQHHLFRHLQKSPSISRTRYVECAAASPPSSGGDQTQIEIPSFVVSPVLAQVYPALIAHKEKYGNPNIPLGSTDGKRCKTLRRLHFQNKLTEEEASHLTELGFRFHSFEDVYYENDFDEMLEKLLDYRNEFQTYQIPKKYDPDPELGAWVTMLRRLQCLNELPKEQIEKLDDVKFEWISTRKCGSSFMSKYREIFEHLNEVVEGGGDVSQLLSEDAELKKWLNAQRLANENGNLSESRVQYIDDLPGVGIGWRKKL